MRRKTIKVFPRKFDSLTKAQKKRLALYSEISYAWFTMDGPKNPELQAGDYLGLSYTDKYNNKRTQQLKVVEIIKSKSLKGLILVIVKRKRG